MRWPWARSRRPVIDPAPAREAAAALAEAKGRQAAVDRVVAAHKRLQWENHLGERVHQALTGEATP